MGIWSAKTGSFVTWIKTQATITALIGTGDSCRCWPRVVPQGATMPVMMFVRTGGDRFRHLSGGTGKARTTFQIYTYGDTADSAESLMKIVIAALDNFRGTWDTITVNDTQILLGPEDGEDYPRDNSQAVRYWCRLPLAVIHSES